MISIKFEEQVSMNPTGIAVKFKQHELTYDSLNKYANRISRIIYDEINNRQGSKHKNIALLFEHGIDMIKGVMGAVKAGITYTPLEPSYPEIRLKYILKDCEASVIVTNNANYELASDLVNELDGISIINIDIINEIVSELNMNLDINEDSIAYILYTSGSTGIPKGVVQNYKNIYHFASAYAQKLKIGKSDNMTLFSAFSHDAAIVDIFGALLFGATLFPVNVREQMDIGELSRWLNEEKITIWHSVPTLYRYFTNQLTEETEYNYIKYIVLGGESVLKRDIEVFNKYFDKAIFVNLYGQTESSINSLLFINPQTEIKRITLGENIKDTSFLILDEEGFEVETLISGEIAVASNYLALEYWKDEERTNNAFIEDDELGRMYFTGDLGRYLDDGSIEILGRKDNQIKIRGYRVELGEIESKLLEHEQIKEAAVLAKEDSTGDKYIYAYITEENQQSEQIQLTSIEIKEYLSKSLAEYMIPFRFIKLDTLPLTPTGKVDRKSLADNINLLEIDSNIMAGAEYEAPRNEIEEKLVQIWREVLSVDKIGINDNFFELGGHSLKATSLISKIHKELDLEVPLNVIFKTPTIKAISEHVNSLEKSIYAEIQPVSAPSSLDAEGELYDASSAQKRVYTLQQFELNNTSYNMPKVFEIVGELNKERLENAFKILIQRHEALRTSFKYINGKLLQQIHTDIDFKIQYIACNEETEEIKNTVNNFIKTFNLSNAPLLRVGLIEVKSSKHILMLDVHHIISDGVSMSILTKEFINAYEGRELPELRIQYKDYAVWQNQLLKSDKIKEQEQYWLENIMGTNLQDEIPILNMPTDYIRPSMQSFEGDSIDFSFNKELTQKLKQVAKVTGSTLYMILMATFNILLSKYSGQEDIIIGSPIAGRPHADLENIIGMFVNTLAMRNYPKGEKTVREFLIEVKDNALRAFDNQDYQFEELVNKLTITRDMSRNPVFDVMFILQNMDISETKLENLQLKPYNNNNNVSKFDITLIAAESEKEIKLNIQYCTKLFNRQTIENLYKHYENISKQVVENLDSKLNQLELITEEEKKHILLEFNNTETDYPKENTIHKLFEEQAKRNPDKIAVVYEDKYLTYSDLNTKANQLARVLKDKIADVNNSNGSTNIIGLMVNRSLEMIVGIMAILKSGGAYLPIDPEYPNDRIEYMLKDSGARILLTHGSIDNLENVKILNVDDDSLYGGDSSNLAISADSTNTAYVIYTSGSTGNPKGVVIGHYSVNNFIKGMTERINFSPDKKILALTTICFDIFGLETLLPLTQGMEIVIAGEALQKDPNKLVELIEKAQIDILQATPSRMEMILESIKDEKALKSLKEIIIGGEAFPKSLADKLKGNTNARIYNVYGPTETTIWSTLKELSLDAEINIGKPIANTQIYIVDKNYKLQPIGIPGELCIGGDGLAKGYLNREELTEEKFIDNPYTPYDQSELMANNTKMYKTGDLAKWLPDGSIEFIGRMDYQVKIRGYRIELGEIESKLIEEENIKEAIVLVRENKKSQNKCLCAYIVGENIDTQIIKASLKKRLPDYMVPNSYVTLDKMPQTANGKINKKALIALESPDETKDKILPIDYIQNTIADIWKEILGVNEVYINDDFFELGGNSINIIQVASKIKETLDIEVNPADLMVYNTIAQLTEQINDMNSNNRKYKHLFKLNRSKSTKNIFIVHGGDADIFYYRHLAKLLEDEYNVYGIQPSGLKQDELLPRSFYEMYHNYVKEIRMVQSEGPYILGGYCIGGYISFDITKIFEMQGEKVSALLQLDQEAFVEERMYKRIALNDFIFRAIDFWRKVSKKDKLYTLKKIMDLSPKAKPVSKEMQMGLLKNKKSLQQYLQKQMPFESHYCFIGKSIKTPTIVIKAEGNNHRLLKKELWENMAKGPFEYYEVPGGHETVLLPPYIEKLSEIIKDYLHRTL